MKQFYRWKQSREWSRECEPKTDVTKNNSQWQENATTNWIPHDTPAIASLSPIQNPGMHKKAEDNLLASKNWDNVKLHHISKEKMEGSSDTARIGTNHLSREDNSSECHPKVSLHKNCTKSILRWNPSPAIRATTPTELAEKAGDWTALVPALCWACSSAPKEEMQKKCIRVQKLLHATSTGASYFKYKGTKAYGTCLW